MKALDCMVYKEQAASWNVTLLKIDAPTLGEELELLLGVKRTELLLEQFLVRMLTALTISDVLDPTPFKTVYSILYFISLYTVKVGSWRGLHGCLLFQNFSWLFPQRVVTLFLHVAQTLVNFYLKGYHSLQTSKACWKTPCFEKNPGGGGMD